MALNRPVPAHIGDLAALLGADRTTLTAALKTLVRRNLATISPDSQDARIRRIALTPDGHARLALALPHWTRAHAELEAGLDPQAPARLRRDLGSLARPRAGKPAPALCDFQEVTI